MSRVRPLFNNFVSGELSPLVMGRVDSPQYRTGCKTLNNWLPDRRGGAYTRPPLRYQGGTKDNNEARFIPHIVSRDIAYIIEATAGKLRFWKDGALVLTPGTSNAVEVTTPYTTADVLDIQYAQANDEILFVVDGKNPRKLVRNSGTSWTLSQPVYNGAPWNGNADGEPGGFPRTICYFQQRLVFAGRIADPQTIWMSRTADFTEFAAGATNANDDPLTLVIAAYTQELIQWLSPSRVLIVGTTGNEHRILPNGFLAPANPPDITRQSSYGSRYIQPVFIGTETVFVQASGIKLRNYGLNLRSNVEIYDSLDLTLLSNHFGDLGLNQIAYQQIPESILWAVTDDGQLLSMTYDPSLGGGNYEGLGWAKHDIDGIVESLAVIPRPNKDEVWLCVRRGVTRNVVRLDETVDNLDFCAIQEAGSAFTVITGLEHLANEEVSIILDGATTPNQTVTAGGTLTVPRGARYSQVGLSYSCILETMPIVPQSPDGSSLGRNKWMGEIYAKLHESYPPLINGKRADTRHPSTPQGQREPFITGDVKVHNLGKGNNATIRIEQDVPFKSYVLALHGNLEVGNE